MMDEDDGVLNRRINKKVGKKKEQHRIMLNGLGDSNDELDWTSNIAEKMKFVKFKLNVMCWIPREQF